MDESRRDLLHVDGMVRGAWTALLKFRAKLHADSAHPESDPLEPYRAVAGASALADIRARNVAAYELPIKEALIRWISFLTEVRINLPLEIEWMQAADKRDGRLDHDPPRLVSYRQAFHGIVSARSVDESLRWWSAAADCAPALGAIARERRIRAEEIHKRLGNDDAGLPLPADVIVTGAEAFLAATSDLASEQRKRTKTEWNSASAVWEALARDATEGWPPRASGRWFVDLFGTHTRGLDIVIPTFPAPVGGSSFARMLSVWGGAFRRACPARSLPFSMAEEPLNVSAVRSGLLFASLVTTMPFHLRALGTTRRAAHAQSRALSLSALFAARKIATETVLATPGGEARFSELSEGLLGVSADGRFAGAWPRSFGSAPTQALALLTLLPLRDKLIEQFDDDWFRNPAAFAHLRSHFSGPAREVVGAPAGMGGGDSDGHWDPKPAAAVLARAFEKVLG